MARFKSHTTGVFKETIVQPDHPIEKGLKPIESWDETYVHEMHNEQDRTVLSYRIEGDHKEPYTWTRTRGRAACFTPRGAMTSGHGAILILQNCSSAASAGRPGDWALEPQPKSSDFTYTPAEDPDSIRRASRGHDAPADHRCRIRSQPAGVDEAHGAQAGIRSEAG